MAKIETKAETFACELCGEEKLKSVRVKTKDGELCKQCAQTLNPEAPKASDAAAPKRTAAELKELIVEQAQLLQARKELSFAKMFKLVLELKANGKA